MLNIRGKIMKKKIMAVVLASIALSLSIGGNINTASAGCNHSSSSVQVASVVTWRYTYTYDEIVNDISNTYTCYVTCSATNYLVVCNNCGQHLSGYGVENEPYKVTVDSNSY